MAVEFGKGITLAGGFDLGAKAPLDSRLTVATIADRDAHVTNNRAYEGMLVYVEADKVTYQYVDGNWNVFGFNETDFQAHVIDNLTSDSATQALSARQGKILNERLVETEALAAGNASAIGAITDDSVALKSFKDVEDELKNYATDANAQKYASDAQAAAEAKAAEALGKANEAAGAAAAAASAASNAQTRADDAYALADAAVTNEELNAKNYATKNEAQGYADAKDEAIATAQKAADDAADVAAGNAATIATLKGGSEKTIAGLDSEIAQIAAKVNNLNDNYATDEELEEAANALVGTATTENTILWAKNAADSAATTAAQGVSDAAAAQSTANNALSIAQAAVTDGELANAIKDFATDTEVSDAVAAARGDTTETVASVNAKAVQNATSIANLAQDLVDLESEVEKKMQAADAMTFEGTVATEAELLAKTNVNKGDTYKATADFKLDETQVYIGDLLIAQGTEVDGILQDIQWTHVPSGYRADYVPAFSLTNAADSNSDGADDDHKVTLNLTSAHAATGEVGDLGAIDFKVDENSALTIAAVNTAAKKAELTIGLAWGTF